MMSVRPSRSRAATLIGMIAIALWSALALLTATAGAIPPFELAALTFTIASVLGVAFAAWRGRMSALRQPWLVWLVGIAGLFGYHALYFAALSRAPAAEASLIAYLWPLLIVLFSALLPGERLLWRHVIGAALGFAGAAALFADKGALFSGGDWIGYALALACAFVWSAYSIASRQLRAAPTEAVAGFCMATAALATICHFVFESSVAPAGLKQWLAIAGLGLGPVGVAFFVWDYGVKHGDIRLLGVASYAAPALSTIILVAAGEAPARPALGLACALIVIGALVASVGPRAAPAAAKP